MTGATKHALVIGRSTTSPIIYRLLVLLDLLEQVHPLHLLKELAA